MKKSDFQIIEIVKKGKNGETEVVKTFELTPVNIDEFHSFCYYCDFAYGEDSLCDICERSNCGCKCEDGKVMVWQKVKK